MSTSPRNGNETSLPLPAVEVEQAYSRIVARLANDDGTVEFESVCTVLAATGRNANELARDVAAKIGEQRNG